MMIDTFINSVYLYDDRVVMMFNNKEDAKTVTLAEIEESYSSDITAGGVA